MVGPAPAAPATPNTPSPADTATTLYTLLSWLASGQAWADVYLSTTSPPTLLVGGAVGFSYIPTLLPSTTYYWKIVAANAGGSATGPIWSFTTPAATAVIITLAGVDVTSRVRWGSAASIHDAINAAPNTASLLITTPAPTEGEAVEIGLGSLDEDALLFGGEIQTVDQQYVDHPDSGLWPVSLIDHTFTLNKRRPFGTWTDVSATTIALAICAKYAPGFTTAGIQAGLPTVSITFDGQEDFMTCLGRLAMAIDGGIADVTYRQDVLLFTTDTREAPDPIDASNPPLNTPSPISFSTDLAPIRTRVYGKGHGETTLVDCAVGAVTIPITDSVMFNPLGGQAIAGTAPSAAQSEILTYAGVGYGYTPELSAWHSQQTSQLTRTWTGVVWAEALGLFVAVSGNSDLTAVMTSPDGFVWTTRVPAVASTWEAVAWSPTRGLFAAVSINGLVMTSPNGITWTARTAGDDSTWQDITWAAALGLFVAVAVTAGSAGFQVMTSPDGIVWTGRAAANANQWHAVEWSATLGLLVAVAQSNAATNAVMTSTDGLTWTARVITGTWFNLTWSPTVGLFVAVAGANTATSPDGITWTVRASALPVDLWYAVIWADLGYYVALSDATTKNIAVSPDGLTWTLYTAPANTVGGRWAITWAPTLGRLVAVGFTGALAGALMTNSAGLYDTLTGINANNGLVTAIAAGSPVHIWVERNDLAAQAALGLLELDADGNPTDGIREFTIIDERRGEESLIARCDADLATFSRPIVSTSYYTRDRKSKSGKSGAIDLTNGFFDTAFFDPAFFDGTAYGLSGAFVIQSVDITFDGPLLYPLYHVQASSVAFTLMDLLRRVVISA